MNTYFKLQHKLLNRKLTDFGIPLVFAYTVLPIVFMYGSNHLISEFEYAHYAFTILAIIVVSKLSEHGRTRFLKRIYTRKRYLKLRCVENCICSLPFIGILLYNGLFFLAIILVFIVLVMAMVAVSSKIQITIPTPFGKHPYEYTIGFRTTFWLFPLVYVLVYIAVTNQNFNLGIFALMVLCLVCMFYYSKPENTYFVWNYKLSPKAFLIHKIKISLVYFSILSLPIISLLALGFITNWYTLATVFLLCQCYIITSIFSKYATYPNEINFFYGLLVVLSIIIQPLLIFVLPYLYTKAIQQLRIYMHDYN